MPPPSLAAVMAAVARQHVWRHFTRYFPHLTSSYLAATTWNVWRAFRSGLTSVWRGIPSNTTKRKSSLRLNISGFPNSPSSTGEWHHNDVMTSRVCESEVEWSLWQLKVDADLLWDEDADVKENWVARSIHRKLKWMRVRHACEEGHILCVQRVAWVWSNVLSRCNAPFKQISQLSSLVLTLFASSSRSTSAHLKKIGSVCSFDDVSSINSTTLGRTSTPS